MEETKLPRESGTAQVDEPELNVSNIQGNIIPGFNKDFQTLLFLKIEDGNEAAFRRWLEDMVPYITTMEQVLGFRSLFKEEEQAGKHLEDPPRRKATWRNIAFSYSALERLGAIQGVDFKDDAFKKGLTKDRAIEVLGDPKGETDEGNPKNWKVGGRGKEADMILIVASDDRDDLLKEIERIEDTLSELRKANEEKSGQSGLLTLNGTNLPGGCEHFGFRDGISQPGLRAQVPRDSPGDYLTRGYKSQDKPDQDLLWPGEFVFGRKYPRQDLNKKGSKGPWNSLDHDPNDVKKQILDPPVPSAPAWAEDGSFLVFRRLRQDVGAFHKFLHDEAERLNMDPGRFGAKCIGRWPSGTPIVLASKQDDDPTLAQDDKNNNFKFGNFKVRGKDEEDLKGVVCPFAAHIRKVYPRDDVNESEAQTHRLLRRGIPYGERSLSSPTKPLLDSVDRGLLFLAYQTSIENQFEFLQKQANNPNFKEPGAGYDPIIGQDNERTTRTFSIKEDPNPVPLPQPSWVIPTGGGYFFAPSIEALQMLAHASQEDREAYFSARSINDRQEMLAKLSDKAQPKVITPSQWARIWAHAWLEGNRGFADLLKQNPKEAIEKLQEPSLQNVIPIEKCDRIFDMDTLYKKSFTTGPVNGKSFKDFSNGELIEIISEAKLKGDRFCVQPNEWKPKPKE